MSEDSNTAFFGVVIKNSYGIVEPTLLIMIQVGPGGTWMGSRRLLHALQHLGVAVLEGMTVHLQLTYYQGYLP